MLRALLIARADVGLPEMHGVMPLHYAASSGSIDAFETLLDA